MRRGFLVEVAVKFITVRFVKTAPFDEKNCICGGDHGEIDLRSLRGLCCSESRLKCERFQHSRDGCRYLCGTSLTRTQEMAKNGSVGINRWKSDGWRGRCMGNEG